MPGSYVWTPTSEVIARSNLSRFMRTHKIAGYRDLVARSIADTDWFWKAVIDDLGIEFSRPFDTLVDLSAGMPWARWFIGGQINVAHNCVDRHAQSARRDHVAVIWDGEHGDTRRLTYAELHAETCRLSNALKHLGISRGDAIGLFLPLGPEAVIAFMSCAQLGAIAIPIFSGFGAQAVAARLADADAKLVITVDATSRRGKPIVMEQVAAEAARACPHPPRVIVARRGRSRDEEQSSSVSEHLDWDKLIAAEPTTFATEPLDSEAPLMIAYTSGTTGKPKGAVHVHGGFLVKIAQEVAHQVDMHADDTLCWVTDLGWIMGPWEIVGGLAAGGTIVAVEGVPDYPTPDRLWSLIERERITILGVSPTLVRALMRHGVEPLKAHDLSSLRMLASTGEPWDPESWRWLFENAGKRALPIINISGGTEVGACLLSVLPIAPLKPCSLGGPALGMAVDVYDADGKPLRRGVGELVCTNPWPAMTRGIWGDPDRYIATYWSRWPDVWVHGDWASIDDDGDWFLHGRSDDTLNVAGKRLGPAEVESIVAEHAAVAESAAISVPDSLKGEVIHCYVVLRDGHAAGSSLASDLRHFVASALGKSFAPEQVKFVDELPKTRSGKILRRLIRKLAIGEDLGDISSLENRSALDAIRQSH
jgi:acetyl-CoA synthetase